MGTAGRFSTVCHVVVNFNSGLCASGEIMKNMKPAIQMEMHLYYIENAERSTIVIHGKLMFLKYKMSHTNNSTTELYGF